MPTYEYACASCGNHFDTVQSFSEEPLEKCEICGGRLRRVFHPAGILFKGSGFYSTDNRRGGSVGAKAKPGDKNSDRGERSTSSSEKSSDASSNAATNSRPGSSSESKKTAEKSA